jgi:hypothetical protein
VTESAAIFGDHAECLPLTAAGSHTISASRLCGVFAGCTILLLPDWVEPAICRPRRATSGHDDRIVHRRELIFIVSRSFGDPHYSRVRDRLRRNVGARSASENYLEIRVSRRMSDSTGSDQLARPEAKLAECTESRAVLNDARFGDMSRKSLSSVLIDCGCRTDRNSAVERLRSALQSRARGSARIPLSACNRRRT